MRCRMAPTPCNVFQVMPRKGIPLKLASTLISLSFFAACQTGYSLDTCMGSGYIGSFEMLLYDYEEGQ